MSLECKVYVKAPGQEEEIRRISIETCPPFPLEFSTVRYVIATDFPILNGYDFDLYWIDAEGDKVRLSSNKDLHIFMKEAESSIKKIYVTLKEKKDHITTNVKNNVHGTVTCDECRESPLQGYRYKCLVCHNYDLCSNCEKSESIHPEHPMIRIPVPLDGEIPFGRKFQNVKNKIYGTLKCLLENS